MNGQEIHNRIEANNKKIHAALDKFVLTDEINILMKENEELSFLCPHNFKNGFCEYCNMPLDFWEEQTENG